MERRQIIAGIIAATTGTALASTPPTCPWPGCQKKGKIEDGDLLVQWYKGGKVVNVHAFHIIEKHMAPPKWSKN